MTYDPSVDAGYASIGKAPVARTERAGARLLIDYADDGQVVGCELLDASMPLEMELLRSNPLAREALGRIHAAARKGSAQLATRFLVDISADRGTLKERRLRVAANVRPETAPALVSELRRKGLLTKTDG